MKKGLIATFITLIIIAVIAFGVIYKNNIKHPFNITDQFMIKIDEGESLYKVLDKLKEENKLKHIGLTKIYMKLYGNTPNVKPGMYTVDKDTSLKDFFAVLENPNLDKGNITVTIPEGYNINQIADLLEKKGVISKEEFIKGIKDYKLPSYIKPNDKLKYNLEGFLFPDTYIFKKGNSANDIIKVMNDRFNEVITKLTKDKALSDEQLFNIITMASIIENEASDPNERDIVASVFYNRLDKDMMLQSCATVLYSLGKHKDKLYEKDLEIESPYNTYKIKGLPVGPICCPGEEAIKAAINPKKTNYLFFVSNNDGTHFFTDNYEEFLKVKEKTQGF